MSQAELELPPDSRFVGFARLVVVAAARQAGMDEAKREDLRIAVSEAATSAIAARMSSGAPSRVLLRFGVSQGGFEVTVCGAADGHGAVGEHVQASGRNGWAPDSELATTVIRGLADRVDFVSGSDGGGAGTDLRFRLSLGDGEGIEPVTGPQPPEGVTPSEPMPPRS